VLIHAYFLLGAGGAQTPYYEGKTVTILRGGSPGGYGTLQAQALMPYLKKYIPGNPFIFIDHMPGAAGRKAANYIYSVAKPDGLTIGAVGNVLVSGPILGLAGTNYDLDRLIYLGSTESGRPTALGTRKEAGLDSLEKLRAATGIRIGAHSVGHITYVTSRIFAYLLGVKEPRFVVGYSAPERDAALMAGEIDAGTMSPSTIQQNPALLEKVLSMRWSTFLGANIILSIRPAFQKSTFSPACKKSRNCSNYIGHSFIHDGPISCLLIRPKSW
jgi:tripartite-type tricarboxylate transporter receptor subunit TctC